MEFDLDTNNLLKSCRTSEMSKRSLEMVSVAIYMELNGGEQFHLSLFDSRLDKAVWLLPRIGEMFLSVERRMLLWSAEREVYLREKG